jgi:hypothetical protein
MKDDRKAIEDIKDEKSIQLLKQNSKIEKLVDQILPK